MVNFVTDDKRGRFTRIKNEIRVQKTCQNFDIKQRKKLNII